MNRIVLYILGLTKRVGFVFLGPCNSFFLGGHMIYLCKYKSCTHKIEKKKKKKKIGYVT